MVESTMGASATSAEEAQKQQLSVIAALMCMQAKDCSEDWPLKVESEAHEAISREYEERLCANWFTVAAAWLLRLPWAFQRNEKWFEDTLPHLGKAHFRQLFRTTPATFRYLVDSLRGELEG